MSNQIYLYLSHVTRPLSETVRNRIARDSASCGQKLTVVRHSDGLCSGDEWHVDPYRFIDTQLSEITNRFNHSDAVR